MSKFLHTLKKFLSCKFVMFCYPFMRQDSDAALPSFDCGDDDLNGFLPLMSRGGNVSC